MVVLEERQRIVQKGVIHMQYCCFAFQTYCSYDVLLVVVWSYKVPIVFVTCCYHTPSSIKERTHSLLSYSVSSVKDGILFPSFHIFARVDREKSIRILNVWTRIKKRGESLVRCRRGLNINYGSICIWFILRILTTDYQHIQKYICLILLLPTVCDQDRLRLFSLVTAYIFVINYQP